MSALSAVIIVSSIAGVLSIPAALCSERDVIAVTGFGCALVAVTAQLTLVILSV